MNVTLVIGAESLAIGHIPGLHTTTTIFEELKTTYKCYPIELETTPLARLGLKIFWTFIKLY